MKFLLDESADARLIPYLGQLGHDATWIVSTHGMGLPHAQILAHAYAEQRILIAADRDFGELVVRFGQPHAGVILLRLGDANLATKIARLEDVLSNYSDRLDRFLIVTLRGVRVRQAT